MSDSIRKGSELSKSRTLELLKEASELDLTSPSQTLSRGELQHQYEIKLRIVKEKIAHLEYYAGLLETANQNWLDNIQSLTIATRRKEEETKYANMVDDPQGDALLSVRGYDIAPENYDVIIGLLKEKYGKPFLIKKSLYNELNTIKKNDREWKATIEAMERTFRQLEAIGENLEHSSIEITIENKLPAWIIDKLYQLKEDSTSWKNFYKWEKEPCVFCNKDHWNNECNIYPTLKLRMERLREITACFKCLRKGHATSDCKKGKPLCFHCKSPHNTALCPNNYKELTQAVDSNKERLGSVTIANSITEKGNQWKKRTLLLCKEINVTNPNRPKIQQKALILFDIGSQLSFISKDLAYRLNLQETNEMEIKIASFGDKTPKTCITTKLKSE
ncbi:Uncharacterized protein BM_BM17139 [Brugia malayi]|uniref:CCHC-type domain-containing protein n=1 Tax=Brugia malayi TaxID=6279 RepID=A0A4E9G0B2_BRUMA|nr:Uncharacterized protein BM_BM17139 [Brugia malayi]VIP00093.1 Uncharacterized protein BM_BM17139 [Brugia malayi]